MWECVRVCAVVHTVTLMFEQPCIHQVTASFQLLKGSTLTQKAADDEYQPDDCRVEGDHGAGRAAHPPHCRIPDDAAAEPRARVARRSARRCVLHAQVVLPSMHLANSHVTR